jgi:hypothetical protein
MKRDEKVNVRRQIIWKWVMQQSAYHYISSSNMDHV